MNRKGFGLLVSTLRKEMRNEFDETLTQPDLAALVHIPVITLQKIEQGRQVNLKPEMLLDLANVFNLPTRARQVFFLAALGIRDRDYIKQPHSSQAALQELTHTLGQLQNPAFVADAFGDILSINPAFPLMYDLDWEQVGDPHLFSQYNINRLLFSPEFSKQQAMLDVSQHDFSRRLVLFYKMTTLKYRSHWCFVRLLPELNRYPLFREHWQSPNFHDEDIFNMYNNFSLHHPRFGSLNFISSLQQTITSDGDLYLYNFIPADTPTAEACLDMVRQAGTAPIPVSPWPKPHAATGPLKSL